MYQRILVTLDGSHHAESALAAANHVVAGEPVSVYLLQVASIPAGTPAALETEPLVVTAAAGATVRRQPPLLVETRGQAIGRVTEESLDYLDQAGSPLKASGAVVESVVKFGDAGAEITRFAADKHVDLIVMATHGHTGLARLALGSVAAKVVEAGVAPVLLVRPHGLRER
jgi:nucleotide-binding universal stress UspA family protein